MSFISTTARWITEPPFFGLDISDLSIKFMKIRHGNAGPEVAYFGEVPVPPGIVDAGEIKKEPELLAILRKNLIDSDGRRVRDRFVVASLPEEKSFVRVLQLPKMQAREVSAAIRWELEANIPIPLDQAYFDYELMQGADDAKADHLDVAVTVFPKAIVDSYTAVIKGAGLKPLALELESQAISRSLSADELTRQAAIIVDIGLTRTSFTVLADGVIVLTTTIDVGGRDFDNAISKSLGISLDEAEKIKKEIGLDKKYRSGELVDSLIPLLSALVDELKKQLWYFRDHAEHRHGSTIAEIQNVLLVGGDTNLIGLDKYLAVSVKKPVHVGNPFIGVYGNDGRRIPPLPRNASLKYATSIGLAERRNHALSKF